MTTAGATCSIHSTLRSHEVDTKDFCAIKNAILGKAYALSVVLIGNTRAKTLNMTHRQKATPANVLSFPLDIQSGEIFLNVPRIQREARSSFGLSFEGHLRYLFIHGCLHLKGYQHGSTMEEAEATYKKKFNVR